MINNHEEHIREHNMVIFEIMKNSLVEVRHHDNYFINMFYRLVKGPKLVKCEDLFQHYYQHLDALIPKSGNLIKGEK